jgi:Fibronectin type III domain
MNLVRFSGLSGGLVLAALLTGCALELAPSAPSLHIPQPVHDLTASRAGDLVTLDWNMPRDTTDKVLLQGRQRAEVCRSLVSGNCDSVAALFFAPKKPASYVDHLPQALDSGSPRLLTYYVDLESPAKKSAGHSNPARVVAGTPPPPVGPITLRARKDGVVLAWTPEPPQPGLVMRIHRTLVEPPHASQASPTQTRVSGPVSGPGAGAGPVANQFLEVDLDKTDPGRAIDRDVTLDHTYTYVLQRVLKVSIANQAAQKTSDQTTTPSASPAAVKTATVELAAELPGASSLPATIHAEDVFPPAPPQDLQAVADEQDRAIDLSWAPSSEADVVGYTVYRREADRPGDWRRISPATPLLAAPAYHDAGVQPGVRYAYAVRAIDRDGNQSPLSAATEETLPQQ